MISERPTLASQESSMSPDQAAQIHLSALLEETLRTSIIENSSEETNPEWTLLLEQTVTAKQQTTIALQKEHETRMHLFEATTLPHLEKMLDGTKRKIQIFERSVAATQAKHVDTKEPTTEELDIRAKLELMYQIKKDLDAAMLIRAENPVFPKKPSVIEFDPVVQMDVDTAPRPGVFKMEDLQNPTEDITRQN